MKFVNASAPPVEDDKSDQIRMTGVVADLTTSGVLERRIYAEDGWYSDSRGILELKDMKLETYQSDGRLQGRTKAAVARSYFADQESHVKGDMVFNGGVEHRAPDKKDAARDAIILKTDSVAWDERAQKYLGKTPYEMEVVASGKQPLVLRGSGFQTTANMQAWTVKYGMITTEKDKDVRGENSRLIRELQDYAAQARQDEEQGRATFEKRIEQARQPIPTEILESGNALTGEKAPAPEVPIGGAPVERTSTGRKVARLPMPQSRPKRETADTTSPESAKAPVQQSSPSTTSTAPGRKTARIPMRPQAGSSKSVEAAR